MADWDRILQTRPAALLGRERALSSGAIPPSKSINVPHGRRGVRHGIQPGRRLAEERDLLQHLPLLPDTQCAQPCSPHRPATRRGPVHQSGLAP